MNDLDNLFNEFESRKSKELDANERKKQAEKQLSNRASLDLRDKVLPVLNDFSASIQKRGHESEVTERIDNYSSPNIELKITLKTKQNEYYSSSSTSTIRFIHNDSAYIQVDYEIGGRQGRSSSMNLESNNTVVEGKLTQEWVRSKTLSFVQMVLNSN